MSIVKRKIHLWLALFGLRMAAMAAPADCPVSFLSLEETEDLYRGPEANWSISDAMLPSVPDSAFHFSWSAITESFGRNAAVQMRRFRREQNRYFRRQPSQPTPALRDGETVAQALCSRYEPDVDEALRVVKEYELMTPDPDITLEDLAAQVRRLGPGTRWRIDAEFQPEVWAGAVLFPDVGPETTLREFFGGTGKLDRLF